MFSVLTSVKPLPPKVSHLTGSNSTVSAGGNCIFCPRVYIAVLWFSGLSEGSISFLPGLISLPHAAHQPLI